MLLLLRLTNTAKLECNAGFLSLYKTTDTVLRAGGTAFGVLSSEIVM